ncbi:hypothetical protein [Nocardia farcinica]|uniref:hypothetical protein n=1 Tax=Nocardia farcinica TaxID=37329 RepID=UPI002456E6CE|nr:hypothetical protein [Nocardia farcinica]
MTSIGVVTVGATPIWFWAAMLRTPLIKTAASLPSSALGVNRESSIRCTTTTPAGTSCNASSST